jgi:uncharacterized protein YgbK (DUF1537 family)
MHQRLADILGRLPQESEEDLLPAIREQFLRSQKTLIVLDDDPTGTQTCYDVTVLTAWSVDILMTELRKEPSIVFILTNSRSLPGHGATALAGEIGRNLVEARRKSGRDIAVISRSDSTLRGHFPAEVDALADALEMSDAIRVLVPAFIEGGRVTIGDIHYIREQDNLIPVAETPFAQDTVFGYKSSNLKQWVHEKTKGRIKADDVVSVSILDLRVHGPSRVAAILKSCKPGQVCFANACTHKDLSIFVMGLLLAEREGFHPVYRTSATFVSIRAGLASGKIWQPSLGHSRLNGSLVVVGSYVPKSTRQLVNLLQAGTHQSIEVNVRDLLLAEHNDVYAQRIIHDTDRLLAEGKNVVIHTSRQLEKGTDAESSLKINGTVSAFLVEVVQNLSVRPGFIVAKGGITSSDLATKALRATKARVLGQIIPGVPVWRIDVDSKFPDITYIVFPGNVGDDYALLDVCSKMADDADHS